MKKPSLNQIICFVCQVTIACIFGFAVWSKFKGQDIGFYIFDTLGIPETRLLIATLEGLAVVLLFIPRWVTYGALLSFGVMLGAAFAHITVLGWSVQGDGGELSMLMIAVLISSAIIMYIRRKELPLIGHTID